MKSVKELKDAKEAARIKAMEEISGYSFKELKGNTQNTPKDIILYKGKNNYYEDIKNPLWQRKRLEIMQRDNFKCTSCGDDKSTLNVHHLQYLKNRKIWDYENEYLTTYCEKCHQSIHKMKKEINEAIDMNIIKKEHLYEIEQVFDRVICLKPQVLRRLTNVLDALYFDF